MVNPFRKANQLFCRWDVPYNSYTRLKKRISIFDPKLAPVLVVASGARTEATFFRGHMVVLVVQGGGDMFQSEG